MHIRMMRVGDLSQMTCSQIDIGNGASADTVGRSGIARNFEEGKAWILWYTIDITNVGGGDGDDSSRKGWVHRGNGMYIVRARESMYIAVRIRHSRNRRGYEFGAVIEDQTGPVSQSQIIQST